MLIGSLHVKVFSDHLHIAYPQVAKLKEEKSWLEGQVNSPDHAMPMSLPARAPMRHLSL